MAKFIILQTVATDYRKKLFDTINQRYGNDFLLYAGEDYFEPTVKTDKTISYRIPVTNYYFFNRKILFQIGMWKDALTAKTVIMEMNPRILSNWLLLILRKIAGKKTVLWGHAWPRKGKDSISDIVRHGMRNLSNTIITYTKTQAEELQEKMPNKKIVYAPNSLFYSHEMTVSKNIEPTNIIYVGRLTKKKKPALLIEAFAIAINKLPQQANLIIVGDGEEKEYLQKLVKKHGIKNRVKLLGHISDYEKLKSLYNKALFSVSPGYVGLSITQSFGFGVPMLISKNEPHSPEIEAAIEGKNSIFFKTNDVHDLVKKILSFYNNQKQWIEKREQICRTCKFKYSIEFMAKTFFDLND
ncbi:putative glycosyltransferase [Dissulfuribacter thermophilus]|uniref:Putative glycosyltransferase n=1 Tax=Dissulfuribacter thermophilus TaxID=1156395 RepID=A0A1B9F6T5_9BACT|nr:glycosyltransferase [Dissulfuribacter thermophilus]OCC15616.1 putative glycosyltransferase [Dissulfuribacter thermophilus]